MLRRFLTNFVPFSTHSLVFQPVTVLREIADCVEGTLNTPIRYQLASSKAHGSGTDYIQALIKTADAEGRPSNMTAADLDYAATNLDARLMQAFQYDLSPLSEE
jgi:hypothetical protein